MIDVREQDFETIKRILKKHVPECEVRAFGSRVKWTAKDYSDLDLAVIGKEQIPLRILTSLKEDLEAAAISFRVDVLDWNRISESFRGVINEQFEIIQIPQSLKLKSGWRYLKVSDFAKVIGGGTPKTQIEKYWNGDIPWITPKDLSNHYNRYISRGERNISDEGLKNSSARILPPQTVLLTSRAPVGYVAIAQNEVATNQGFKSLVVKDGFDYEFIYYVLFHNTEYLKLHAAGSTFQELSGSTLSDLIFLIPPLPEQRAIAHILKTLDDKIESNRRMNETLEAMAHALFKSWFVDFDPVIDNALVAGKPIPEEFQERAAARESLGDARKPLPEEIRNLFSDEFEHTKELGWIPKGWKVKAVNQIIKINPSVSLMKATEAPFIDMKALPTTGYAISEVILKAYSGGAKFQNGDVLLARITPCLENGKTGIVDSLDVGDVGFGSTEFIVLRGQGNIQTPFIACLARDTRFRNHCIQSMVGSSGRQRVQNACFANYYLAIPEQNDIVIHFQQLTQISFDKMTKHTEQSRSLTSLRDTLLPKLLSGDIRISDAETLVDEAKICHR